MLKRIRTHQLRKGMYVKEMCGSWLDHPFWRTSYAIDSDKILLELHKSSVSEVWIDTTRGLDLAPDIAGSGEEADEQQAAGDASSGEALLQAIAREDRRQDPVPAANELARAAQLCANARSAVQSMFQEARMGKAVDIEHAQPLVDQISESVMRNPGALISLARLKQQDDYTYMHSVAVCALMVALARELGLQPEEIQQAGMGGLLHDLGKSGVPLEVLNKPGRLTDTEFSTIKAHPRIGHEMLLKSGRVGTVPLDICLHHHEKVDGSGYPHGLHDNQISLHAKMGAVCDVYDAITSNRPYKAGWEPAQSLSKMAEWCKGHFDERVFHAFVKSVGIYPTGSLVRLESGHLGVVIEQGPDSLLNPSVRVFYDAVARTQITPRLLDLAQSGCHDRIVGHERPSVWGFKDLSPLWAGDTTVRG